MALIVPVAALAMSVVERDFAELVALAEQVVVGRVVDIRPGTDDRGGPLTLVSFADLTVLKGEVGRELTLEFTGGKAADGKTVAIADMPRFTLGERAVLFVRGNGRDICPLVGVWQGRFRVVYDPQLKSDVVERHDGLRLSGLDGAQLRSAPRGSTQPALSLSDFESLVREELAHPSSPAGGQR